MTKIKSKFLNVFLLAISLVSVLPIAILGFYSRPSADDYDYSIIMHDAVASKSIGNVISAPFVNTIQFYNNFAGNFTSTFLQTLHPMVINDRLSGIVPMLLMTIAYIAIFYIVKTINRLALKKDVLFEHAFSSCITAALFIWLPSLTEGLYWFSGAVNYTPGMITVFVVPVMMLDCFFVSERKVLVKKIVSSSILVFFISGVCQTVSFEQVLILMCITAFLLFRKRFYSLAPFLTSLLGFLLSFLAPGTKYRQSAYERATVFGAVKATIEKVRADSGDAFSLMWLVSILMITPFAIEICRNFKEHMPKKFPVIQIMSCLMIICGMWCAPYYPTQTFGAGRLANAVWISFTVFSWFIYVLILGWLLNRGYISERASEDAGSAKTLIPIIGICLLVVGINNGFESNTFRGVHDLRSGRAKAYATEVDARLEEFHNSDEEIVYVDPIQTKDTLLYFTDIYIFPDEWPNYSVGKYFGKKVSLTYDPFTE